MAKKISYNEIQDIHEDWNLDERNGFPYSGDSVQKFLKKELNSKGGEFYFDADTSKYLVFADAESRDLYLEDREQHADLLLGTFDAPANYVAEITMATPVNNVVLSGTKGHYIDFTFDIKSRNGSSTGEAVIATFTFNNAGNIKKVTQIYNAGTNVHFLADEYLSDGANVVSVVITGRNTLVSTMAAVNYMVVALKLASSINFAVPVEQGDYLEIPYTLEGAGVKYLEWYIDGVILQDVDTIPDLRVNRVKNIDTSELSTGKHSIQARAYITNGGVNFYSSTLYFDFVVAPENELWGSNTTFVLLNLALPQPAENTIEVTATQYEDFICKVAIYDSRGRSLETELTDNGSHVRTITLFPEEPQVVAYTPTTIGEHILLFTASGATASIEVTVASSEVDIQEVTDQLLLKLSAKGRSNTEANPATWVYDNIETTFTGFAWTAQSGWYNDTLVIPAGSNIEIDLSPLNGNVTNKGRTIEIDLETSNVTNENATILQIVNAITNAGLEIKATTAKLLSSGGTSIETKYRDGDRVHLAFIINKTSGDDARMLYIVNNGIVERAARFAVSDNFNASGNIVIGSNGCTVRLHSIRVYDRALTTDEAFCNYAVDSPDLISIASKNDIYDADSGAISVDKVNSRIPVMIITGDISYIMGITDKAQKNAWNPTPVQIEFRNMQNPEMNFFIDDADIRLQGTSSISYPRKNFRIYSKSKSGKYNTKLYSPTHESEDLVADGKYAFRENSAPVSCWCLKADYAESSGSHNVGIAKLWNNLMYNTLGQDGSHPLRTAAQAWASEHEYPYDVRTTIDGFPIVLFQRDSENSPLTCFGQYNFNNDKSTEDVFGFTALTVEDDEGNTESFDNSHVECWEVLDSDNAIALFTNVSNFDNGWSDAFEARYPDKNTNVTALKRISQWINSCYLGMSGEEMQIDLAKWQAEKASYFDLPKLAAYYVYLMRFGAVDQTVKNAMFTTEDGVHWFYINYDNDTVLGIDNASNLFNTWDYGLKTKTPQGGYYYAGKGMSVLWNCFEADSECMALVREIDEKLFAAGMTYEAMCAMFDNEQCGKWCERIYNENGRYKYIEQALLGQNVLYMLQGSRKSHRHWWLQHRLEKYDNVFGTGTYTRRSIQARATGTVNIPQGATYKFVPAKTANYGYSVASTVVDAPTMRTSGLEYTSTGLPQATGVGNLIYIHNANNLHTLDLSGYINALGTVNVSSAVDVNGDSELRSLILGDGENENQYLTDISGLSMMKGLLELDIRGYKAITNIDMSGLPNLLVFHAENSGLTSFMPANGSSIGLAALPDCLQSLILNGVSVTRLEYTISKTLQSVSLANISGTWDAKSFVNTWLALFTDAELEDLNLILTGINWTNMTAEQVLRMGKVGTKVLRGRVVLSSMTQQEYEALVAVFGANVFNEGGQFIIDAPTGINLSGPTELLGGQSGTFTAAVFPVTESSINYLLYDNSQNLITAQTDGQGKVYRTYNGVTLYEESGIISVDVNLASNTSVFVRAQVDGTSDYSAFRNFVGKALTYPSSVSVNGTSSVSSNGIYNYTKNFNTDNFTAQVLGVAWSLTSNEACHIYDSDSSGASIQVTNTPATALQVTLSCTVTFTGGVTRTGTKTITLQLTFPSSVSISGDSNINDNGDYNYTKTINGSYTASLLSVAWSLTSNENVTIKSSDDNGAVVSCPNGNDAAVTLTLTCVCTFTGNITRTGTKSISVAVIAPPPPAPTEDWVDLGLPSGLLWCTHNVGAASETDAGLYFAWGETTGYVDAAARNTALGLTGGFDQASYNAGSAASISADLTLAQDGAHATMGGDWRMPSKDEFQELYDNTDREWTAVNGINGTKFMKKSDHSVFIFMPAKGYYSGNNLNGSGAGGCCWSSSYRSSSYAYFMDFSSSYVTPQNYDNHYKGYSIRAVREAPKLVDLGLPSGKLWADRNVGATSNTEAGLYFAWGETEGYVDAADRNAKLGRSDGFSQNAYNAGSAASISADLTLAQDAANKNLGGNWRTPSKTETQELYDNTDREWTTINGVSGYKFMKKSDHSVFIFIPAKGKCDNNNPPGSNATGYYGSSSFAGSSNTYYMFFDAGFVGPQGTSNRYYGMNIRAIQDPPPPCELVDLGLPSGTLWADRNIGATAPEKAGLYFAWGETTGYVDAAARNAALGLTGGFDQAAYNAGAAASISADLTASNDAATVNWGSDYRMPNEEETKELYDNTDREWTTLNGVNGYKFMKKSDHSVFIFLPIGGEYEGNSLILDSNGFYWSSSYSSSSMAYRLQFSNSVVLPKNVNTRYLGISIRAVQ